MENSPIAMENSPMNFYLSSLEEQVRCELLDSEARLTQTTTKDRVLLEIDEDCLQHFLDVLHEKNETTKSTEMEISKNLCQATFDKQLDVISQLKEALHKAQQELKNGHRQWQEEKSSLKARQQKNCDHFHSQVQVIASIRAKEQEAVKQTLEKAQAFYKAEMESLCKAMETVCHQERFNVQARQLKDCEYLQSQVHLIASLRAHEQEAVQQKLEKAQAFHQAQMDEQRAETNRIAAALKDTQNLLEVERIQHKTTTKAELEILQARIVELLDVNRKLTAAFIKAENELKNGHLLWRQEKSSFMDQNKKACELYHTQVKITAGSRRMEREATQMLQRFQAAHKGQLDEQRAETSKILAVLKKTEDQLEAERLYFLELASRNAHLEKTCRDLDHAQLKNLATLQTLEEEATQMVKRNQASQAQLEEQGTEINRIKAARKKTEDLFCEHFLWQQEKSSILQATEDLQATNKDLQSQSTNMQKKKEKWFKFF